MIYVGDEFKESLLEIAEATEGDDYRKFLKKHLNPITDDEVAKIINAFERITSVLKGNAQREFIEEYSKRIKDREKFKRKYKDTLFTREDAITYTGVPESTFDKKANDFKKTRPDGKPGFNISDLDNIARLILQLSKSALCINTHYYYDRKRDGFLPFYGGEYYKVVDETEKYVYLYNEKWKSTIMISKIAFKVNFRVEDEIDFLNH